VVTPGPGSLVLRDVTNPITAAIGRLRAWRLQRAAHANREIVHLLMPYDTLMDARDRLADVAAEQEDHARRLRGDQ
jgi:hypothetical protein